MYRFLFSSKWLGYLLLAAIFATACVLLGRWQMDRRAETLAEINRVVSNYSATPIPFAEVRNEFVSLDADREWTQVQLRGSYDAAGQRIVRNRPLNGQPGYEVVVPFKLDSGDTVVIDRGWLPDRQQHSRQAGRYSGPTEGACDGGGPAQAFRAGTAARRTRRAARLHRPARVRRRTRISRAHRRLRPAGLRDPADDGYARRLPDAFNRRGDAPVLLAAVVRLRRADVHRLRLRARQQARNAAIDAEDAAERAAEGEYLHASNPMPRRRPAPRKRKNATAEEEEDAILDAQGL